MKVTKVFGDNLRRIRQEKGISQEALALEANLNRSYVGSVERGERNVSLVNICKLARTLGILTAELMVGVELDDE